MLGGGIDHDRDAARLDDRGNLLEAQAAEMFLLAEQHHHRHRLGERLVEIPARIDLDQVAADHANRRVFGMMTRLIMPSVNGRRSILTGSLPATQAAVPSATAAALPQVTMPHSAPVSSASRLPAASISSSRLTK